MDYPIQSSIINQFDRVFIDLQSKDSSVAQRILKYFPQDKIEWVDKEPLQNKKGTLSSEEFNQSKRLLFVTPFPGHFFKRCPGATQKKVLTCCNYYVLNLGQQCNMNCSYCYLQSYINSPVMKLYSNIDQALLELEDMAKDHSELPFRVGTGEVIDSLSLDEISLYSRKLIQFFAKYPRWTLEFKTKSSQVDQFLDIPHAGNAVVSWSINPAYIIEREEHGTARFSERMEAAIKCRDRGFKIAFHIDPMIWHEDWQKNYGELVDIITQNFVPKDLHIISIGALRFQPEQRHMMRERFGMKSLVTSAEVFVSEGGKMRYDSQIRQQMFDFVLKRFKSHSVDWNIFMCMETPENWIATYDKTPMQVPELKEFFRPLPKIKSESIVDTNSRF